MGLFIYGQSLTAFRALNVKLQSLHSSKIIAVQRGMARSVDFSTENNLLHLSHDMHKRSRSISAALDKIITH